MLQELEKVFKALGEPTRLQIVKLLSVRELCVCELEAVLQISQPRVSQHLKVLRQAGIVSERKERQRTFVSLNQEYIKGTLPGFAAFMQADFGDLEGFGELYERLRTVDAVESVRQCKARC